MPETLTPALFHGERELNNTLLLAIARVVCGALREEATPFEFGERVLGAVVGDMRFADAVAVAVETALAGNSVSSGVEGPPCVASVAAGDFLCPDGDLTTGGTGPELGIKNGELGILATECRESTEGEAFREGVLAGCELEGAFIGLADWIFAHQYLVPGCCYGRFDGLLEEYRLAHLAAGRSLPVTCGRGAGFGEHGFIRRGADEAVAPGNGDGAGGEREGDLDGGLGDG